MYLQFDYTRRNMVHIDDARTELVNVNFLNRCAYLESPTYKISYSDKAVKQGKNSRRVVSLKDLDSPEIGIMYQRFLSSPVGIQLLTRFNDMCMSKKIMCDTSKLMAVIRVFPKMVFKSNGCFLSTSQAVANLEKYFPIITKSE